MLASIRGRGRRWLHGGCRSPRKNGCDLYFRGGRSVLFPVLPRTLGRLRRSVIFGVYRHAIIPRSSMRISGTWFETEQDGLKNGSYSETYYRLPDRLRQDFMKYFRTIWGELLEVLLVLRSGIGQSDLLRILEIRRY